MAQRKQLHEEIAENLKAQREGSTPEETAENDLDKREVQQRIMDPNGTVIDLSYGKIVVYPFTLRDKRRAGGFIAQVTADAIGGGARSEEEALLRIASLLLRRDDLERELFRLAAVACFKPGSFKDEDEQQSKTLPLVAEFYAKATYEDTISLFRTMTDLAEFKAPKA